MDAAAQSQPAVASKSVFSSKTFWVSALTAIVPLVFPAAAGLIAANPALFSLGVGAVFGALRFVSHGKLTLTS